MIELLQRNSDLKVSSKIVKNSCVEDIFKVCKTCTVYNSASQLSFTKPYQRNTK